MAEQQNPLNNIHTNAFQTLANQTIRNVERINRNRLQTEENNIIRRSWDFVARMDLEFDLSQLEFPPFSPMTRHKSITTNT